MILQRQGVTRPVSRCSHEAFSQHLLHIARTAGRGATRSFSNRPCKSHATHGIRLQPCSRAPTRIRCNGDDGLEVSTKLCHKCESLHWSPRTSNCTTQFMCHAYPKVGSSVSCTVLQFHQCMPLNVITAVLVETVLTAPTAHKQQEGKRHRHLHFACNVVTSTPLPFESPHLNTFND